MITSNQPNAAKLLSSLRNSGYDSYTAIEDIVDNSIDAGARKIDVRVESEGKDIRVTIADNGSGMDEKILDEALKLGSDTEKNDISDLGKYGMGLCTASISIARKLEVITKRKDGEYLYSAQDLDHIVKVNRFDKETHPASKEERALFDGFVGTDHGTVVTLSKTDRLSNTNTSNFAGRLSREMSRIFRKFIAAGIEITVNGKKLEPIDPLMEKSEGTRIYSDEEYEIPGSKNKEKIRVKIAILPELTEKLEEEEKMNIQTQGFYILRNNREIENAASLGIFKKHNRFNRLRAELYFSSSLDNEMGVRFSKDGVSLNQVIHDFLAREVGSQINSIGHLLEKAKKATKSKEVSHDQSALLISKKSKLLITPTPEPAKRAGRSDKGGKHAKPVTRTPVDSGVDRGVKGLSARFETLAMGRSGVLYDCYQEGKTTVIQWNVDHPFYAEVILKNDNEEIRTAIDCLVYAFATAELKSENDENVVLMNSIKSIMSANLSALLS